MINDIRDDYYENIAHNFSIDGNEERGMMVISAEELIPYKEKVVMEWSANKLDRKDIFGKSDPFMVISRKNSDRT